MLEMWTVSRHWLRRSGVLALTAFLVGCGGGGGGGGGDNPDNSVTYTGNTLPAVLTSANSEEVVRSVMTATDLSTSVPVGAAITDGKTSGANRLIGFGESLHGILLSVAPTLGNNSVAAAEYGGGASRNCARGGTLTASGSISETTGDYSATVGFSNCVQQNSRTGDPIVINGHITASGHIDGVSPSDFSAGSTNTVNWILKSVNISGDVSLSEGSESLAFSGGYNVVYGYVSGTHEINAITITTNLDISAGGIYFRVRGYEVRLTPGSGSSDVSISGDFCHSVHGCVSIETITPFHFAGAWPDSGQLVVTGADGAKVRLTAISVTQYRLELDVALPVDGVYEETNTGNWSGL